MKRNAFVLVLIFALCFSCFSACSVVDRRSPSVKAFYIDESLLSTGTFEENGNDAIKGFSGGGVVSSEKVFEGNCSLLLKNKVTETVTVMLEPFSSNILTFYALKTAETDSLCVDSGINLLDGVPVGQWTLLYYSFPSGSSRNNRLSLATSGKIYIDNVAVIDIETTHVGYDRTYLSDVPYVSCKMENGNAPLLDDDSSGSGKIGLSSLAQFDKGVRMHPDAAYDAEITYDVSGYEHFTSFVGKDANGRTGDPVTFEFYLDGTLVKQTAALAWNKYEYIDLDLSGKSELKIVEKIGSDITCGGGSLADASLYKKPLQSEIFVFHPTDEYMTLSSSLQIAGRCNADSVAVYVNNSLIGSSDVMLDGAFCLYVENLPKNGADIQLKAVNNGVETGESRVIKTGYAKYAHISDLVWKPMLSQRETEPLRDKSELLPYLAVGKTITAAKGFEVRLSTTAINEVSVDISGVDFRAFFADVGICPSTATQNGNARITVLADGKEIFYKDRLNYGEYVNIFIDIPENTKLLTLRTESPDSDITQDVIDWCNPVLLNSRSVFLGSSAALNTGDEIGTEILGDCSVQFIADKPFAGIRLENAPTDSVVTVYRWQQSLSRTVLSAPIYSVKNTDGVYYFGFPLDAGEYLISFSGDDRVSCYESDKAVLYAYENLCKNASPKISVIFTDEDTPLLLPDGDESVLSKINNVATEAEKQRAKATLEGYLDDLSTFPTRMNIGGELYNGFNGDFTLDDKKTEQDGNTTIYTLTLMHKTGLELTLTVSYSYSYAAYDYVIYIKNTASENSPIISDLQSVNLTLEGKTPYVATASGDSWPIAPVEDTLNNTSLTFESTTGRSTEHVFPYYNIEYGDRGMLMAIGWAGAWKATFTNSENLTEITAGQRSFSSYLKPGETARTALCAFVLYDGRNPDRAMNLWRRWFIDEVMHRVEREENGETVKTLLEPTAIGNTSVLFNEMAAATDQNQIDGIKTYIENGVGINFWWMDAGWYTGVGNESINPNQLGSWAATGTWEMDKKRFPSGMSAVSDYGKEHNVRTLLWFEPERFGMGIENLTTDGKTISPDWLLNNTLVNEGNPEAAAWILNRILTVMGEGGISLYREDFNIHPLSYWQWGDAQQGADRNGITENLYIQGHFQIWDAILETFPEAIVDSCASGGNRLDFDTMTRAVALHKTDCDYGNHAAQQCYAWVYPQWIPYFGTKTDTTGTTTFSNKYSIRTALVPCTVFGYNYDQPIDWAIVRDAFEEREKISKYFYCDYYPLTPYSYNENSGMAWEYLNADDQSGFALVFRRGQSPATQTICLKGLDPNENYRIWFEDRNSVSVYSGKELMVHGIEVTLPCPKSSDIIYIQKESAPFTARDLDADITYTSLGGTFGKSVQDSGENVFFDIRFNMSLRSTVLNGGTEETGITGEYQNEILINQKPISEYEGLTLTYDVLNNILRVVVPRADGITADTDITLTLKKTLTAHDGTSLANDKTFTYSAESGLWS